MWLVKIRFIVGNLILYVVIFVEHGVHLSSILECLLASVLVLVSISDAKTLEIPWKLNQIIFILGLFLLILQPNQWKMQLLGALGVSGFLMLLYLLTRGQGIGGGDIKLMASTGFFIGITNSILAFTMASVLAVIVHPILMLVLKKKKTFPFGPYLCVGVYLAMLIGDRICFTIETFML